MQTLSGKTVLITGASSGIGRACVEAFAREGARLILTARRHERLDALAAEMKKVRGTDCLPLALDIRSRSAVEKFAQGLPAEWCAVDILINNAGLARGLNKVYEDDPRSGDEMIDTNIKGALNLIRAVVPGMVERGRGHIINIGSIAGHETYPGGAVYCATKHALDAITKGLRMDLLQTPVRVSTVDPGLTQTEFSEVRFHGDKTKADAVYRGLTPLTPTDIAETVLFVATRPPHVQIAEVIVLPTAQASALLVDRRNDT